MSKRNQLFDGDAFEYQGRTFTVYVMYDEDMRAPWVEHDGHGPVREARSRHGFDPTKGPGERLLYSDRGNHWFYDWAEAIKIAKRDGWGMSREDRIKFAWRKWRCPTKGEIAAHAVQQDYDYLRRWLSDQWHWAYVRVICEDDLHGEIDRSIGGLCSDDAEGIADVAYELADEIADELNRLDEDVIEHMDRVKDAKEMFG